MNHLGNLRNVGFKETKSIRIGHHHGCNIGTFLIYDPFQIYKINQAVSVRFHLYDFQATNSSRGWISAMCTIRNDDLFPIEVSTRTMIVVNRHQTCQFTMSASIGFKGKMSQPRQFAERLFQERRQGQCTFCCASRLRWMQVLELWQCSHFLINLRVVLHRTRAERIEPCIHAEVVVGEVGIVAHHCQFITLGQLSIRCTTHGCRNLVITIVILRQTIAFASLFREFENQIPIQFLVL